MSVQWHCMSGKVDSHIDDIVGPNLPIRIHCRRFIPER